MIPNFVPELWNGIEGLYHDFNESVFGDVCISIDSLHREKWLWVEIIVFEIFTYKPVSRVILINTWLIDLCHDGDKNE